MTPLRARTPAILAIMMFGGLPVSRAQTVDKFSGVAPKMQEFVDRGEINGVVTLLATKDRILHLAAVGKSDLASDRKMKTDDLFWIASMSKPITAACLGILIDDGKVKFDDPVNKYVPEFSNLTVQQGNTTAKPSHAITLHDLLTHTSGLGDLYIVQPYWTLAETSQAVAKTTLRFEPGTRWNYSTAGLDTIGRVVEVVSCMPFDQFMQKRLLDPLGMKNTAFWIAPENESRWVHSYQWDAKNKKLDEIKIPFLYGARVTDRTRPPLGGLGLFSTAEDTARFYQMMLNQGELNGQRILKPQTVAEMTRKQTGDLAAHPGMPWGLGFCVVEDPTRMEANSVLSPNSFGHGGAFSTQSWADPTKNLIWVLMIQRTGHGNPDDSDIRIAFQDAAIKALNP